MYDASKELREIRALCKAIQAMMACNLSDAMVHGIRARLKTVYALMNLEWQEDGDRVVAVRLPHCRGVDVMMPLREWYSPEEARALADELLRAAREADPPEVVPSAD